MKKIIIISLFLAALVIGCEEENRKNLNKLEVGMTRGQVIDIMGNPYRREAQDNTEWLLYRTESKINDGHYGIQNRPESGWLTPLVLEDGKLRGWGNNFWVTEEQKIGVKIDQKFEQK